MLWILSFLVTYSYLNIETTSFVIDEQSFLRAFATVKIARSTYLRRVLSSHFVSPRNTTPLCALQHPELGDNRKPKKRVERAILDLTKAIGTNLSSTRNDDNTAFRRERYASKLINMTDDPNISYQNILDKAITMDALELPSGSRINVDRDLMEVTEALLNSRPDLPREYFTAPDYEEKSSIQYLEDQFNQMMHYGKRSSDSSFRAVFENESGFFNQSEAFRMYLAPRNTSEDPLTIVNKAVTSRRGEDYRRRQNEALEKLQQAMEEVEKISISKSKLHRTTSSSELCSICGCRLSREEIIESKCVGGNRVCRECFVEKREFKNGSPYLIGRFPDPTLSNTRGREGTQTNTDYSQSKQWRELFTHPANPNSRSETIHESHRKLQDQDKSSDRPSVSPSTLDRIKMLESELDEYKKKAKSAEDEIMVLRGMIADLETKLQKQNEGSLEDPDAEQKQSKRYWDENEDDYWVSMVDPDTGETFRWNKYTGETDW